MDSDASHHPEDDSEGCRSSDLFMRLVRRLAPRCLSLQVPACGVSVGNDMEDLSTSVYINLGSTILSPTLTQSPRVISR